jgi:hypothetical protein
MARKKKEETQQVRLTRSFMQKVTAISAMMGFKEPGDYIEAALLPILKREVPGILQEIASSDEAELFS